jgi:hypothetical protein
MLHDIVIANAEPNQPLNVMTGLLSLAFFFFTVKAPFD